MTLSVVSQSVVFGWMNACEVRLIRRNGHGPLDWPIPTSLSSHSLTFLSKSHWGWDVFDVPCSKEHLAEFDGSLNYCIPRSFPRGISTYQKTEEVLHCPWPTNEWILQWKSFSLDERVHFLPSLLALPLTFHFSFRTPFALAFFLSTLKQIQNGDPDGGFVVMKIARWRPSRRKQEIWDEEQWCPFRSGFFHIPIRRETTWASKCCIT